MVGSNSDPAKSSQVNPSITKISILSVQFQTSKSQSFFIVIELVATCRKSIEPIFHRELESLKNDFYAESFGHLNLTLGQILSKPFMFVSMNSIMLL